MLYDEARRMAVEETWAVAHRVLAEMGQSADERVRKRAARLAEQEGERLRG
jgi:hypothetical protein